MDGRDTPTVDDAVSLDVLRRQTIGDAWGGSSDSADVAGPITTGSDQLRTWIETDRYDGRLVATEVTVV